MKKRNVVAFVILFFVAIMIVTVTVKSNINSKFAIQDNEESTIVTVSTVKFSNNESNSITEDEDDYINGFIEGKAIYDAIEFSRLAFENQLISFSREDFDEFQSVANEFINEIVKTGIVKTETINRYNAAVSNVPNSEGCMIKSINYQAWHDSIQYSFYSTAIYERYQIGEISEIDFSNWQNNQIYMFDNLSHKAVIENLIIAQKLIEPHFA